MITSGYNVRQNNIMPQKKWNPKCKCSAESEEGLRKALGKFKTWSILHKISTDWGVDEDIANAGNVEKCWDWFGHAEDSFV